MAKTVREALLDYYEAQAAKRGETLPEKFYPKPNREAIRRFRFGGYREGVGTGKSFALIRPNRSRIQRGRSGESVRGVILDEGFDAYLERR
ncbi:hypothetical protein SEA_AVADAKEDAVRA_55 [Mycobacterium phage AvadaKedavra]|uniref:Uncharacterized protein n=1 Tax=Mycobacterium phage AvadaKedavra TaxID=2593344 RepID=A0A514U537_9CAUD|nr:hypothetical protein SEA_AVADAKEDAVRA_55 [Mycobacterium phage AvadaKedavra]